MKNCIGWLCLRCRCRIQNNSDVNLPQDGWKHSPRWDLAAPIGESTYYRDWRAHGNFSLIDWNIWATEGLWQANLQRGRTTKSDCNSLQCTLQKMVITPGVSSVGFQLVWAADNRQIAIEDSKTQPWSLTLTLIVGNSKATVLKIGFFYANIYACRGWSLHLFFPLPPSFTPLCVSVWYGKNVTHAETAAAMATTHSLLYGQLTSGLWDLEVRQHKARTHAVFTMRYLRWETVTLFVVRMF